MAANAKCMQNFVDDGSSEVTAKNSSARLDLSAPFGAASYEQSRVACDCWFR